MQKVLKSVEVFQSYEHKCTATFFFGTQCIFHMIVGLFDEFMPLLPWSQGSNCAVISEVNDAVACVDKEATGTAQHRVGQQPDLVYESAKALTWYGLLDLCQRDAIREADGPAMISMRRINMLRFWSGKHHKYLKAGHRLLAGLSTFFSKKRLRQNDRLNTT